jgi:glutaredoxin
MPSAGRDRKRVCSTRRFATRTAQTTKSITTNTTATMKTSAKFYHAGCPVCLDAESVVTRYLDTAKVNLEVVHLGSAKARVAEAEAAGVRSVPALVIDGNAIHLNFGAALADLK